MNGLLSIGDILGTYGLTFSIETGKGSRLFSLRDVIQQITRKLKTAEVVKSTD